MDSVSTAKNDAIIQMALLVIIEKQADIERIAAGQIDLEKDRDLIRILANMGLAAKRKFGAEIPKTIKFPALGTTDIMSEEEAPSPPL